MPMSNIDLTPVQGILTEVNDLVRRLDGQHLDERNAVAGQSKGAARKRNAFISQDLRLLYSRLQLAAALVDKEYWKARGETDPIKQGSSA